MLLPLVDVPGCRPMPRGNELRHRFPIATVSAVHRRNGPVLQQTFYRTHDNLIFWQTDRSRIDNQTATAIRYCMSYFLLGRCDLTKVLQFIHETSVDHHPQQIDRHTFNYLRAIITVCCGKPDSPIEYCRSLAWMQSHFIWSWFWSPWDQLRERMIGIRRSAQLFQWNYCRDRVEVFVF
jgi:hypothetical protein